MQGYSKSVVSDGSVLKRSLVPTVCPYCSVGCGFYLVVEGGRAVGIEYMPEHPVNEGALCPKGNAALEIIHHPDRLKRPLKRSGNGWTPVTWDEALGLVAKSMTRALRDHGPASLGFLGSSKCTNEENYLFQKLARCLGSGNVDNCARLCHASTVVGLGRAIGACATTNPLADLANSRCIFVIGSNFAENHPVLVRSVLKAKDAGAKIIVVDPRRTPTAWLADLFLQIRPGSDIALLNGMMNVVVEEGLADGRFIAERTRGFEELARSLEEYTPERAAKIAGVSPGQIVEAARAYATSPASSVVYSMGLTQHAGGTENIQALANLFLICGQIGKPGAGVFPLRGQNNVQGACDMGTLPEFYPGYRRPEDPRTAKVFGKSWGCRVLPGSTGLTALEMVDAAIEGGLKVMYIVGEDPANSDPNGNRTREALEGLDFLVVQDIFMTETAQLADVVLPAACWAEKGGTFTSTERRVQQIERAVDPPGEARDDLSIICDLAGRMGLEFYYKGPDDVLEEIKRLVPTYRGITHDLLRRRGFIWIFSEEGYYPSWVEGSATPILLADGFHLMPGGRAVLRPVSHRSSSEATGHRYPLVLTTGRTGVHYNAGSMTRRSPSLSQLALRLYVEINPSDAANLGVADGEEVSVITARAEVKAQARVSERVRAGVVFMPFHFPGANLLTNDERDRDAMIPELKAAACRIEGRS